METSRKFLAGQNTSSVGTAGGVLAGSALERTLATLGDMQLNKEANAEKKKNAGDETVTTFSPVLAASQALIAAHHKV